MLLNRFETAMMNNPLRAAIQRGVEARTLLALGGPVRGGRALEIGCGRGVGVEIVLEKSGASRVDAFDLDPRMVELARRRLARWGDRVTLATGDAEKLAAQDGTYDAVFDFGIIHHVPRWRSVLAEVHRVLRPGGRFYAEEVYERFIAHPVWRRLLEHPREDRFDHAMFARELARVGFRIVGQRELLGQAGWFVAERVPPP